jgi:hypothetical protein
VSILTKGAAMPEYGDILLLKRRTIHATESDSVVYGSESNETPEYLMRKGWKLKHFVSYQLEKSTIREYYFVWPDLFKDAVMAGLSRGEDDV